MSNFTTDRSGLHTPSLRKSHRPKCPSSSHQTYLIFCCSRLAGQIHGKIVNCSPYNSCTSVKVPVCMLFGLTLASCFQEKTFRSLISHQQAVFKDESVKFITKDNKHCQLAIFKNIFTGHPCMQVYFVMKLA